MLPNPEVFRLTWEGDPPSPLLFANWTEASSESLSSFGIKSTPLLKASAGLKSESLSTNNQHVMSLFICNKILGSVVRFIEVKNVPSFRGLPKTNSLLRVDSCGSVEILIVPKSSSVCEMPVWRFATPMCCVLDRVFSDWRDFFSSRSSIDLADKFRQNQKKNCCYSLQLFSES